MRVLGVKRQGTTPQGPTKGPLGGPKTAPKNLPKGATYGCHLSPVGGPTHRGWVSWFKGQGEELKTMNHRIEACPVDPPTEINTRRDNARIMKGDNVNEEAPQGLNVKVRLPKDQPRVPEEDPNQPLRNCPKGATYRWNLHPVGGPTPRGWVSWVKSQGEDLQTMNHGPAASSIDPWGLVVGHACRLPQFGQV
uniref:Uncharacterized protein n=1 Tax=Solanum tuberosum TaxID=4113 RepID=M1DT44_SOLTU